MKIGSPSFLKPRAAFLAALFMFAAGSAFGAELPLKYYGKVVPSDVCRVGMASNQSVHYTIQVKAGAEVKKRILALKLKKFEAKKPSDVVEVVFDIHDMVNTLRGQKGLKPISRYTREDGVVTPAIVYVNAVVALDGFVDLVRRIDPQKPIGHLYLSPEVSGKTPSNAFGQMDLAFNRFAGLIREGRFFD